MPGQTKLPETKKCLQNKMPWGWVQVPCLFFFKETVTSLKPKRVIWFISCSRFMPTRFGVFSFLYTPEDWGNLLPHGELVQGTRRSAIAEPVVKLGATK